MCVCVGALINSHREIKTVDLIRKFLPSLSLFFFFVDINFAFHRQLLKTDKRS